MRAPPRGPFDLCRSASAEEAAQTRPITSASSRRTPARNTSRAIDEGELAKLRAAQRVQRFLDAAQAIIIEKGSTDFTVQEVVDRSQQSLRGLVDGDGAQVHLQPRLEILTDEVRASHGATTGALDPATMFYLLSRGIAPREARRILVSDTMLAEYSDEEIEVVPQASATPNPQEAAPLSDKARNRLGRGQGRRRDCGREDRFFPRQDRRLRPRPPPATRHRACARGAARCAVVALGIVRTA